MPTNLDQPETAAALGTHHVPPEGISMTTDRQRDQVRAAIVRLLAGTPLHSDGALTVVSLAVEASVKRHVLTHRHTDLKDEFYARVRAQGQIPASEKNLREELETTKQRLTEALDENRQLKESVEDTRTSILRSTALKTDDINDMVTACAATSTVIVLDCCYSGAFKVSDILRSITTATATAGEVSEEKDASEGQPVIAGSAGQGTTIC